MKSEKLVRAINSYRESERPVTCSDKRQVSSHIEEILEEKELFS